MDNNNINENVENKEELENAEVVEEPVVENAEVVEEKTEAVEEPVVENAEVVEEEKTEAVEEEQAAEATEEKKESFFVKLKNGIAKFCKGVKNFFIKTGRVNSSNCIGMIEGIGDFLVYDDHALISAVGMDDITFTKENVVSTSFLGLGPIRRGVTVKYKIVLDDNVVFPEKVREKNDVNNLTAVINIKNDKSSIFLGSGQASCDKSKDGLAAIADCDAYGYTNDIALAKKVKTLVNGEERTSYYSAIYSFDEIKTVLAPSSASADSKFTLSFNDGNSATIKAANDTAFAYLKSLEK